MRGPAPGVLYVTLRERDMSIVHRSVPDWRSLFAKLKPPSKRKLRINNEENNQYNSTRSAPSAVT